MKSILIALLILFFVLQYQLWFSKGGLFSAWRLQHNIQKQQLINTSLKKRNHRLVSDIKDLKHGKQALETHAREDLGMIKKNEIFYQVVKSDNDRND